ncbi:MAG: hypothetical protein QHI48_07795 [Bacteroidota bacterium]|nr:hypothetical protein [Bacteroidota bacterium]
MTHTPIRNDPREGTENADPRLLHDLRNMPKVTAPPSFMDEVRARIAEREKSGHARKKYASTSRLVLTLTGTVAVVYLCVLFFRGNDSPPSPQRNSPSIEAPEAPPRETGTPISPSGSLPGRATEDASRRAVDNAGSTSTSPQVNDEHKPNVSPSPQIEGTSVTRAIGKDTMADEHDARGTRQETFRNVEFELEYTPAQYKDAAPESHGKARISGLPLDSTKTDTSKNGTGDTPVRKPR